MALCTLLPRVQFMSNSCWATPSDGVSASRRHAPDANATPQMFRRRRRSFSQAVSKAYQVRPFAMIMVVVLRRLIVRHGSKQLFDL